MQMKFIVHNPHDTPVARVVEIEGEMTSVSINGFEVELKSESEMDGTLKLRFFGHEATEARQMFVADAIITATFEATPSEGT